MTADPMPEEFRGVTPHLVVSDAKAAIDFYRAAFGADVFREARGPDGRIWHVELLILGGRLLLLEEYPEMGLRSPAGLPGTAVMLNVYVPDADEVFDRAVAAGAQPAMEPADSFWGDRYGQVIDPFGHRWSIATRQEDLSDEQMDERAAEYIEGHPDAPTG